MTDTPQILLAHHLKALKLPTFLREYDKIARLCATEGVDHARYLMRLAEMEIIDRDPSSRRGGRARSAQRCSRRWIIRALASCRACGEPRRRGASSL